MANISVTYSTAGSTNWICPPGVTSVQAEMWGGGGGAGGVSGTKSGGGGGAGGPYVVSSLGVTAGVSYPVVVGSGGTAGGAAAGNGGVGGSSWFANAGSALAPGGAFGTGGSGNNTGYGGGVGGTTGAVGTLAYQGGNATTGTTLVGGGAGGGGAGTSGVGGNAVGVTGGTASPAGGGGGGSARLTAGGTGVIGTAYGGGAGGPYSNNTTDRAGAPGAPGAVILTFAEPTNLYWVCGKSQQTAASNTNSFSLTIPSNITNPLLVAQVSVYNNDSSADRAITAITFDSAALTKISTTNNPAGADAGYDSIWVKTNCSQGGTYTFSVTTSGTVVVIDVSIQVIGYASLTQPDAIDETDTNSATTTHTGNVTTSANNALTISQAGFNAVGGATASGADQVETANLNSGYWVTSYSKTLKTPAGTVTHTYHTDSNDDSAVFIFSIAPYVAAPPGTSSIFPYRTLMGVGT